MPELPDILAYLAALGPRVAGKRLDSVRLGSPFLLRSIAPPLKDAEGRAVVGVERITPTAASRSAGSSRAR